VPDRPPVYQRQRFLLALVGHLNDRASPTDLQKIVFLYSMVRGVPYYDFVPYKYGPYSFQLVQDIEVLRKGGYITDAYTLAFPGHYPPAVAIVESAIETLRGDALIRRTYECYPYYAIRSEIAERVLDEMALQAVRDVHNQLTPETQKLFSIGYEGKSIERFVNILLKNGVRLLCDVRRNPISRKFGFSKGMLKHIVENVGMGYAHIPALGIDSGDRSSLETPEDYKTLFASYREFLPEKEGTLRQVYQLLKDSVRIALMCYEQNLHCCHRTIVKGYLTDRYGLESEDI
jgi:uncharacterized protein (DUF488 family)